MHVASPQALLDASLQPSRSRPKRGWVMILRQLVAALLLLLFTLIITGYALATDPERVRGLAQQLLTRAVGGHVEVDRASLSLFEGLQLRGVRLRVAAQDQQLFSARSVQVLYRPLALLVGRFEPYQVIITQPEIWLEEDLETGRWNVQQLLSKHSGSKSPGSAGPFGAASRARLPEINVRNAVVHRSETDGRYRTNLTSIEIEGHMSPRGMGAYEFQFQSRDAQGRVGPMPSGDISLADGTVNIQLPALELVAVAPFLPARVREFWEQFSPSGLIGESRMSFFRTADGKGAFSVQFDPRVTIAFTPMQWLSPSEFRFQQNLPKMMPQLQTLGGQYLPTRLALIARDHPLPPVGLQITSGTFEFNEKGVIIHDVLGTIEHNDFLLTGTLDGYNVDAPFSITLATAPGAQLNLPEKPGYIASLPASVRAVYNRFQPQGFGKMSLTLARNVAGAQPEAKGEIAISDGRFVFNELPYPLEHASGLITLGRDADTQLPNLRLREITAKGLANGPNAASKIKVDGNVLLASGGIGIDIAIGATGLRNEPLLLASLPPGVASVINGFSPLGNGSDVHFTTDLDTHIQRTIGIGGRWTYRTDLAIRDGSGTPSWFAYPLEQIWADVHIFNDRLDISAAGAKHDAADVRMSGGIDWSKLANRASVRPDLKITASNVPIDSTLLAALPASTAATLKDLKLGGVIDIDGRILDREKSVDYDLGLKLSDGGMTLRGVELHAMTASARLDRQRLRIEELVAKQADADIAATAQIDFAAGHEQLSIDATGKGVRLERAWRDALPAGAQGGWDAIRPAGTVDGVLSYRGPLDLMSPPPDAAPASYTLTLTPRDLAVDPTFFPYRFSELAGKVVFTPNQVRLDAFAGHHEKSAFTVSGLGKLDTGVWQLTAAGEAMQLEKSLIEALPSGLRDVAQSTLAKGGFAVKLDKLNLTVGATFTEADVAGSLALAGLSLNSGVELSDLHGTATFSSTTDQGNLKTLDTDLRLDTFKLAGIAATQGRGRIRKTADAPAIAFEELRASIADGELAGDAQLTIDPVKPTQYTARMLLRDADVHQLANDAEQLRGRMSASLSLAGEVAAVGATSANRRGRGEISLDGQDMIRVPLVVNWTQLVSLSLPFSSGFTSAKASYSVDANRIVFTDMSLRSKEMLIRGTGDIDFATSRVGLSFTTDTAGTKLPILGGLLDAARRGLLEIQVKGTLKKPEVSASSFGIFTTSVDEVLDQPAK